MKDRDIAPTFEVPPEMVARWQDIANLMAELIGVPAGLIMRVRGPEIEVFIASQSEGNPYTPGAAEELWGSGLYCETVLKSRERLVVPDALADVDWKNNPDVKLKMVSYMGLPLLLPSGEPFGTICVLDNKENHYSETYERLMVRFKELIEAELDLLYMNHALGDTNRRLAEYISELVVLRGIVPICSHCKRIRDEHGEWKSIESRLESSPEVRFSHGCCPDCLDAHYPEVNKARHQRLDS